LTLEEIRIALLLVDPESTRSLVAISVGAVFFGAATYIGNGPNFMVKAIADQKRVHTPTFLGLHLQVQPSLPRSDADAGLAAVFPLARLNLGADYGIHTHG
jgi:hypothetical protein